MRSNPRSASFTRWNTRGLRGPLAEPERRSRADGVRQRSPALDSRLAAAGLERVVDGVLADLQRAAAGEDYPRL